MSLIETSLVMALRPDIADLLQLTESRPVWPQGVDGEDPRDATAAHGRECLETTMDGIGKMPGL
jgi:creatinine amidohydrolase/Fe(II)-dependent formamide hydrolase-like protein